MSIKKIVFQVLRNFISFNPFCKIYNIVTKNETNKSSTMVVRAPPMITINPMDMFLLDTSIL